MKLSNVDKDNIRAICNFNGASIIFKEVSLGNIVRYFANIKSKYSELNGVQIVYKESKISPNDNKKYIIIYDKGKYIYITGKEIYTKGISYFRNLKTTSKEFKEKELSKFIKDFCGE